MQLIQKKWAFGQKTSKIAKKGLKRAFIVHTKIPK
jgi:hypothetical protein